VSGIRAGLWTIKSRLNIIPEAKFDFQKINSIRRYPKQN